MRRLVATLVVCALPGCSEVEDSEAEAGSFPLRVLEDLASPADAEHAVFTDELDSLEGWWAAAPRADGSWQLSPATEAAAAGGLGHADGQVLLPAGTALLHRVELALHAKHALTARLRGPEASAGDACSSLLLLPARAPTGEELLDPAAAAGAGLAGLARYLDAASADWGAEWQQHVDSTDFALARRLEHVNPARPEQGSRWIACVALEHPLEVDRVRVTVSPQLHFGSDARTVVPEVTSEIAIERVRIGGDSRLAAIVPPHRVLSLPLEVPPQAVDFVLGVCPDPAVVGQLPPGERRLSQWSVRAQPGNHLLAEIGEPVTADRPLQFTDHVLPWPAGLHGAVTLELSVVGTTGMVFGQPRVRGPEHPGAPSLLFISIDTLRADHVSGLGYERPTTPFLDELIASGASFSDVTAVSSFTLPTHASLFTGLFPPRHLALDTSDRVNSERTPTLAVLLSQAGFHTAAFTGGGFVAGDYGFDTGFDRYSTVDPLYAPPSAEDGHGLDAVASWIRRQGQRSWFAFFHTYAAHDYTPPAEDLALFARAPAPEGFELYDLLDQRDLRATPPSAAELEHLVDLYDASIHHVDRRLRELLEPLRAEGLLDDTWIVVTSDHGEEFAEHGRLRHRGSLYEELIRVPLIVVPPEPEPAPAIASAAEDPGVPTEVAVAVAAAVTAVVPELPTAAVANLDPAGETAFAVPAVAAVAVAEPTDAAAVSAQAADAAEAVAAAAEAAEDVAAPPAALRIDAPVSQVDVLPTLLELLGQPSPALVDGRSLAEYVLGGSPAGEPTPLYSQIERSLHARASLRSGPWKLVRGDTSAELTEPATEAWELFDLARDAREGRDLEAQAEAAAELERMRALLVALEARLSTQPGERTRFQPDEELQRRLAELGYLEAAR